MKNYLFLIICTLSILAAQPGKGGYGKKPPGCEIHGSVIDSISGSAIQYAQISILKTDNSIETGGMANEMGIFKIDDIKPGTYSVKIDFMGFDDVLISNVSVSYREGRIKELGEIKMIPNALELQTIKVIDEKPIFEFEADKMVYNASEDIAAGSGTAEDVLNNVPMITVDQDGEVSLRGNPNVKILINGRPNRQGGDVDNIPASLIDQVEVITSPSAKYDPEGMAGIINIVLKKGKYEGFNGSIKFNGKHNQFNSYQDMNGFTVYSNYQQEKYNIYSSISINNRMRTQTGYRRVYNMINDVKEYDMASYDYDFDSESDRFGNSITIGADYSINEKLQMNLEGVYKNHYKDKINNQEYHQEGDADPFDTPQNDTSLEGDDKNNYHGELYLELKKTYDNPDKEILFSITNNFGKDSEYETIITDTTYIDETENELEIDFNYKLPINEKSKLEVGYDGKFDNSKENMQFALSSDSESWALSGINNFKYNRAIHGFFAEYEYKINEKISIKPSLRIEFNSKNIDFAKHIEAPTGTPQSIYAELLEDARDSVFNINEINYFPNFHLTYNLTDKKNFQFSISKRIERPEGTHGWGQLRPFPRNVYNDSFIFIGNPFLKPEFSTQYEIKYQSPAPMGFYSVNVYYRNVSDPIEWYDYDGLEDEYTGNAVTFKNAESANDFGLEFFTVIMGQVLGGGYNINELHDSSNDYQLNGKNERMNLYMKITLPEEYIKIFSYEFGFYYMKIKVPGGTLFGSKGTLWANTGISKSLFDERASISFSINNLFDKGGFQMERTKPLAGGGEEVTEILASRGGRTYSLSIKYHFGKMQEEKRRSKGGYGGGGSMDMGY
tara:strand:+ start:2834 stop:5359 length:2526 start_codon:yes stop_codon:yes gene_type:complete